MKIVLAYSGGLDTSVIAKWLQTKYGAEVIAFTADLGQDEDLSGVADKARKVGINQTFVDDLREEFVADYVFPMFRANALYEGVYLLGTSIARPLIAKRQIEIANQVGATHVSHGATGKGNDQVRFELGYYALKPDIQVIAPWREWELDSREALIAFAANHGIEVPTHKLTGQAQYSVDANLLHTSYEGLELEDPAVVAGDGTYDRVLKVADAPAQGQELKLSFIKGDPVAINDQKLSPAEILSRLNEVAGRHAVGRIDIVENRFVGMKSRGVYETPGGTALLHARRFIEGITLDREAMHLRDELMPKYAKLIYNGFWFSPERKMLQAAIDTAQENVSGDVVIRLEKGNVIAVSRTATNSLYSEDIASFSGNNGYNQADAEGFIKLNALRLRLGS